MAWISFDNIAVSIARNLDAYNSPMHIVISRYILLYKQWQKEKVKYIISGIKTIASQLETREYK